MPIHAQWWRERTSTGFTVFLIILWAINAITLSTFVALRDEDHFIPINEILTPMICTIFLSILHCHICQTQGLVTSNFFYFVLYVLSFSHIFWWWVSIIKIILQLMSFNISRKNTKGARDVSNIRLFDVARFSLTSAPSLEFGHVSTPRYL